MSFIKSGHLLPLLHALVLMLKCPFSVVSAWALLSVCGYAAIYTASYNALCSNNFLSYPALTFSAICVRVAPLWDCTRWASLLSSCRLTIHHNLALVKVSQILTLPNYFLLTKHYCRKLTFRLLHNISNP